jgi:hypothetical protein
MDLKGVIVKHKVFGEGVIKQHDGKYLTVTFSNEDKVFLYPDAFENFLSVINEKIASTINLILQKKKQLEIDKQRIQNLADTKRYQGKIIRKTYPFTQTAAKEEHPYSWGTTTDQNLLMEDFLPKRETLLKIKMDHVSKIKELIEKRKIEYLIHFTRIDNLHSILLYGLVPVSMQHDLSISSTHNDEERFDSKLDCTSCSVGFPNYKLFYTFREFKFPGSRWAILTLDKDLLFSSSNIAYYCRAMYCNCF